MGRFRRHLYDEYSEEFSSNEHFNLAYRKVKRIKGFYSHLRIYIIVNAIIIVSSLSGDFFSTGMHENGLSDWQTYSTALYWGIGLLVHALSVFGRDVFFSDDWEQKKIQEYMDKEAAKNKWE